MQHSTSSSSVHKSGASVVLQFRSERQRRRSMVAANARKSAPPELAINHSAVPDCDGQTPHRETSAPAQACITQSMSLYTTPNTHETAAQTQSTHISGVFTHQRSNSVSSTKAPSQDSGIGEDLLAQSNSPRQSRNEWFGCDASRIRVLTRRTVSTEPPSYSSFTHNRNQPGSSSCDLTMVPVSTDSLSRAAERNRAVSRRLFQALQQQQQMPRRPTPSKAPSVVSTSSSSISPTTDDYQIHPGHQSSALNRSRSSENFVRYGSLHNQHQHQLQRRSFMSMVEPNNYETHFPANMTDSNSQSGTSWVSYGSVRERTERNMNNQSAAEATTTRGAYRRIYKRQHREDQKVFQLRGLPDTAAPASPVATSSNTSQAPAPPIRGDLSSAVRSRNNPPNNHIQFLSTSPTFTHTRAVQHQTNNNNTTIPITTAGSAQQAQTQFSDNIFSFNTFESTSMQQSMPPPLPSQAPPAFDFDHLTQNRQSPLRQSPPDNSSNIHSPPTESGHQSPISATNPVSVSSHPVSVSSHPVSVNSHPVSVNSHPVSVSSHPVSVSSHPVSVNSHPVPVPVNVCHENVMLDNTDHLNLSQSHYPPSSVSWHRANDSTTSPNTNTPRELNNNRFVQANNAAKPTVQVHPMCQPRTNAVPSPVNATKPSPPPVAARPAPPVPRKPIHLSAALKALHVTNNPPPNTDQNTPSQTQSQNIDSTGVRAQQRQQLDSVENNCARLSVLISEQDMSLKPILQTRAGQESLMAQCFAASVHVTPQTPANVMSPPLAPLMNTGSVQHERSVSSGSVVSMSDADVRVLSNLYGRKSSLSSLYSAHTPTSSRTQSPTQVDSPTAADLHHLQQKKRELVVSLGSKVRILEEERVAVQQETEANEQVGGSVRHTYEQAGATHAQLHRMHAHITETEKITNLLLKLSAQLNKVDSAAADICSASDICDEQRNLQDRRRKLAAQLEDARALRDSTQRRGDSVVAAMKQCIPDDAVTDYYYYIQMKQKLLVDAREIEEKIQLGHEQIVALQESLTSTERAMNMLSAENIHMS